VIEVVVVTELVMESTTETVVTSDTEQSVVELAGSDMLLTIADATPEIIEVG
jgi:hypothetical protein